MLQLSGDQLVLLIKEGVAILSVELLVSNKLIENGAVSNDSKEVQALGVGLFRHP